MNQRSRHYSLTMESCVFCRIVSGELPADVVYQDAEVVAFLDLHPIARGHTLVVPRQHSGSLHQADAKAAAALIEAVRLLAPLVQRAVGAEAYNVGINCGRAAGQAVPHTHVHIIPRADGDGLQHWPGTDATPSELRETAELVRAAAAEATAR